MNSFSDSMFIPDIMTNFTIDSEDQNNVVLSKRDGSMRISLQSDRIKLTAPLVEITGNLQVDGEIIGQGGLNLSGLIPGSLFTLFVNGNEGVVGNIQAGGTITPGSPPTPPP
jgi:phage baseplate assembly protein gpV